MPVARSYKPGSIIYFEGDKSINEIFVLQSGKINLTSLSVDTGEETKETIDSGEFFGVKSVLGKYPREETAQVITPSIVLVLKPEEFEKMVLGNFRILMKMLKVFSNQLRRIGKQVREIMQKDEAKMPATELFYIGEYYFKKGKIEQAKYVYSKYIEVYPGEQYVMEAKNRLEAIESGNIPSPEEMMVTATRPAPVSDKSPLQTADSFLDSVSESAGNEQDVNPEEVKKPDILKGAPEGIDITKRFYEALSLFSQDKYEEALEIHRSITSITRFKDETTAKFAEKSLFESARCLMKLGKFMEAIETYSNLLKKFNKTDLLKDSLFNIGECYEKMDKFDKAMNFYQKVVNTPPRDALNKKAKEKLEALQKKM